MHLQRLQAAPLVAARSDVVFGPVFHSWWERLSYFGARRAHVHVHGTGKARVPQMLFRISFLPALKLPRQFEVRAVSATSLDVARTACQGVDRLSMNCTRTVERALAEDAYVLEFKLNSSHGQAVGPSSPRLMTFGARGGDP